MPVVEFGNRVGTGADTSQIGYLSASPGADGAGSLTLAAASTVTFYRADGGMETGSVSAFAFNGTSGLWERTLTGDFDDKDATDNTSVNFTIEVKSDGGYLFDIVGGLSQPIDLDTQDGEFAPGGPDAVQTLLIPAPPDPLDLSVVFFGGDLSGTDVPDSDDVLDELRDGSGDESFVASPDGYVSKVRVNIDNASPYDPATETLKVVVFYESGAYAEFDLGARGSEITYNLGDLFGRAVGEAYDVTMQDAEDSDGVPDATADTFKIDLSKKDATKYLINGFDTLADDLVFLNAGVTTYSPVDDLDADGNSDDSRVVIDGVTVDLIDVVLNPAKDVFVF